jgi:hypothetical protein
VDTFGWTVIGSVAGVEAAAAAVIALLPARRKARLPPAQAGPRAEVSGGQGVQVGSGNAQVNRCIQTFIEYQPIPHWAAELGRLAGLDRALADADLVITGEGRFDETSLTGTAVTAGAAAGCRWRWSPGR